MLAAHDTPDYERPEVKKAAPSLRLIADLLGGTQAMQESHDLATYLPKWPDEDPATYTKRTQAATLYEGLGRTLSASTGMLFATPPTIAYTSEKARFEAAWQNIDGAGTKGEVFVKRFAECAIAFGHALIVVDFPQAPSDAVVTRATEAQLNLAPRWRIYHRSSLRSWRVGVVNNRLETLQVVFDEPTDVPMGKFGSATVMRHRELAVENGVAQYRVWQKPEGQNAGWEIVESGIFRNRRGETRATLPLSTGYAGRTDAPFVSVPPLLGVAFANLSHFRNKTDLAWGSRIAGVEQFVITGDLATDANGIAPQGVPIGWEHIVRLKEGGTAQWIGPTGAGLGELQKRMQEAEQEMAALGMSFLSRDTRAAETAEAKRLDATAENSTLATAAQGIEDAVNLAWEHHAWYEGVEKAGAPVITINRDFDQMGIDAARAGLIAPLIATGLPIRKALEILRDGGFIKIADENEFEDVVMEWESGKVAEEDARRLEAERRTNQPPLANAA